MCSVGQSTQQTLKQCRFLDHLRGFRVLILQLLLFPVFLVVEMVLAREMVVITVAFIATERGGKLWSSTPLAPLAHACHLRHSEATGTSIDSLAPPEQCDCTREGGEELSSAPLAPLAPFASLVPLAPLRPLATCAVDARNEWSSGAGKKCTGRVERLEQCTSATVGASGTSGTDG